MTASEPVRVLLAKPGLDGHDRGLKIIALALRDAGAEVIYLGLRRSIEDIIDAAEAEDVDAIGVSILSGAHLALGAKLLGVRDERGLSETPVVFGGTIPSRDAARLHELGAAGVFGMGSSLPDVVAGVLEIAGRRAVAL